MTRMPIRGGNCRQQPLSKAQLFCRTQERVSRGNFGVWWTMVFRSVGGVCARLLHEGRLMEEEPTGRGSSEGPSHNPDFSQQRPGGAAVKRNRPG